MISFNKNMPRSPAISVIQAFLKNGQWSNLLSSFTALSNYTEVKWQAYKQAGEFRPLPDGTVTISIVAKWLITFIFRKKDEPEIDHSASLLRVIEFIKINHDLEEIKPLVDFLQIFQKNRIDGGIFPLPLWFELSICSIIRADEETINLIQESIMLNSVCKETHNSLFWRNLIYAMSSSITEWISQTTPLIREHVLFEIIKMLPEFHDLTDIIKKIIQETSKNTLIVMPIDLLIYFVHYDLLNESVMQSYLFSNDRRRLNMSHSPRYFLDNNSLNDPICLSFLERLFPNICRFARSGPFVQFSNIAMVFRNPNSFFQKIIGTRSLLSDDCSIILVNEMRNFLNMFYWNHYIFFPRFGDISTFIENIMNLQENWRILLVNLWAIETKGFVPHISQLVLTVLSMRGKYFQQDLFEMCVEFMKTTVEDSSDEAKKTFLKWIISQDGLVQSYFPMSPGLIASSLRLIPEPIIKRKLFWALFYNVCATRYREPGILFEVNMDSVCSCYGLSVTVAELELRTSDGMKPCYRIFDWFWIARIDFRFQELTLKLDFSNFSNCFSCPYIEEFDFFRQLVISLKLGLNIHLKQKTIPSYITINNLLSKCSQNAENLKILEYKDRVFLNNLIQNYFPRLYPADELWSLLRELSLLFPEDVKQKMLESNLLFKMFCCEKQDISPESRKRKIDSDDCEIMCSMCSNYFQTSQIGFDNFGKTICRICSQSIGHPISCLFRTCFAKISNA